jgi:hypothetical protein
MFMADLARAHASSPTGSGYCYEKRSPTREEECMWNMEQRYTRTAGKASSSPDREFAVVSVLLKVKGPNFSAISLSMLSF